jgi:heat-inducible transcriptional repressor
MVALTKSGFLKQPHTSAGRTPTQMALKYYVRELLKEEKLSVADEVAVKEKIWDNRFEAGKFLKSVTKALADKTKTLAVATTSAGDLFHSGESHLLDNPEFYDIDVCREVLSLIDEFNSINSIFSKVAGEDPVHILVGDDFDNEIFQPLSMIFADFTSPKVSGSLGVIGPSRVRYESLIPTVRYFGSLINEIAKSW